MTRKKVSEIQGRKKEIFEEKPGKVLSKRIRVAKETMLVRERAAFQKNFTKPLPFIRDFMHR
jgi:hypothetical protein